MTDPRLPSSGQRAVDELRHVEPPPDLLTSVMGEASATRQRPRSMLPRLRPAGFLAVAAAAAIAAILVLPRLPWTDSAGRSPLASFGPSSLLASPLPIGGRVELRIHVPDGAHTGSADSDSVWLGSNATGRVLRFDVTTGAALGDIAVSEPSDALADLWPVTDGQSVWVGGYATRSLVRVDIASMTVLSSWPLDVLAYRIQRAGDVLWITAFEDDRVIAVDAETGRINGEVALRQPTGIAISGTKAYVVSYEGELVEIDTTTYEVTGHHVVAPNATDVLPLDDDLLIWGLRGRPLERFDPAANAVVATRSGVTAAAVLRERLWVAERDGLAELDPTSLEPRAAVSFDGAGTDQLIASPDRLWAYAQEGSGTYLYAVATD